MKRWSLTSAFGIDNLRLEEANEPKPGRGEVALQMTAWSLNYRDHLMISGVYNPKQPLPLVPLSDGVGEVIAIGEGVDRVALGDRVCPCFAPSWIAGPPTRRVLRSALGGPGAGVLQERFVVDQAGVVAVPTHLSDVEAATLPCAGVTAWSALEEGRVGPGDTVLVEGTGGVSVFALQLARMRGASVIVTSSSKEKRNRAGSIGAHATIDYRSDKEWGSSARTLSGGRGVDCVVDVGGGQTLAQAIRATKVAGTIVVIGVLSGRTSELDLAPVLMNQLRLQGVIVGPRTAFEALARAVEQHQMRPVVDRVFGFDELPQALSHLQEGKHFGKICLQA